MSAQTDYREPRVSVAAPARVLSRLRPPRPGTAAIAASAVSPPSRNDIVLTVSFLTSSIIAISAAATLLTLSPHISTAYYWFYVLLLAGMAFCTLSYQVSRVGAALRLPQKHACAQQAGRAQGPAAQTAAPSVTVLIPTYREEPRVIRHTLLSAVLARHANRRIVVLIDDPPSDKTSVARSLAAVAEVEDIFRQPAEILRAEQAQWDWRLRSRNVDADYEYRRLADVYTNVVEWLGSLAAHLKAQAEAEFAHVDRFLHDDVMQELAAYCAARATALKRSPPDVEQIDAEYTHLQSLFCADITSFQRKQFANLPHEPNKAMNLNAYIGLMGGAYRIMPGAKGQDLVRTQGDDADLVVPEPDFVLTLDADSILRSSYIAELTEVMLVRPRAGVVQTPYLSFPGATSNLERIAGATTDIQYLYHQGSTRFGASFWVGANALLRMAALRDIVRTETRDGVTCRIFIQDDTVIEDTGSTIDLLHAGWYVYNHPKALASSATPSDFGALAIQRRRWSNGGLIIAPRFYGHYLGNRGRLGRLGELLLRSNYLLSTLVGNICVLVIMTLVDGSSPVLFISVAAMLPYFLLYALDLRRLGYRFLDVLGVCSLNLILIPVCLGGVFDSLRQVVMRRRGRFIRTPKVGTRTVVRPTDLLFSLGMAGLMAWYAADALRDGKIAGAVVPTINLTLYFFAFVVYIGLREIPSDLWLATKTAVVAGCRAISRWIRPLRAAAPTPRPARVK